MLVMPNTQKNYHFQKPNILEENKNKLKTKVPRDICWSCPIPCVCGIDLFVLFLGLPRVLLFSALAIFLSHFSFCQAWDAAKPHLGPAFREKKQCGYPTFTEAGEYRGDSRGTVFSFFSLGNCPGTRLFFQASDAANATRSFIFTR